MIEAYCPRCRLPRSVHRPSCPATHVARLGPDRLARLALEHVDRVALRHLERWGIGREREVALDLDRGRLVWRFEEGPALRLPAQLIGAYHHADGLFRWAWSMALDTPATVVSTRLRTLSLRRRWPAFVQPSLTATHREALARTGVAMLLSRAHGVLEVPFSTGCSWYAIYSVRGQGPGGRAGPAVTSDDCRVAPAPDTPRAAAPDGSRAAPTELPPQPRAGRGAHPRRTTLGDVSSVPDFLRDRVVADSHDRPAWLRARAMGITATDAAHLATPRSVAGLVRAKCDPFGFAGNAYTQYGRDREPVIAEWMRQRFGLHSSTVLFRALANPRHLATPDGLNDCTDGGDLLLAEIKTSTRPLERAPRSYLRQIWWQQHVMGARRTLLVWEQHEGFHPLGEPRVRWVERDDAQIARLVELADATLARLDRIGTDQAGSPAGRR